MRGGPDTDDGVAHYQVDLDRSTGLKGGVRPWVDDFDDPFDDPTVFVPGQSASHVTMRGTPLLDPFVRAIKRIAQPGTRYHGLWLPRSRSAASGRLSACERAGETWGKCQPRYHRRHCDLHLVATFCTYV